jgi:hypothetical protein
MFSNAADYMQKDAKLKPLLEILNEGTVGYHEAIAKTQTLKKPCDHE